MIDHTEPGYGSRAVVGAGTRRVLELARRHLGMEVAFLAEFSQGTQIIRGLAGDAASFGFQPHGGLPLAETYCQRMVDGDIPHAVPDTDAEPGLRELAVTHEAGIGSYVGVPVRLADGSVYGSLCTVSHTAQAVDEKDARLLHLLAEMLVTEVQHDRERAAARDHIHELLIDERLEIALQPIVDIRTGHLLGVEALSRFPAGHGPPAPVFKNAHAVGLGGALERLAVTRAVDLLPLLGPQMYLAINLSPDVAIGLATLEFETEVPLDRLVLEITEHAAVENYAALRDSLVDVRRQGLRLAIDDAGAGYASLHHIVELGPDLIKIDRSLIDGMAGDSARRSVVKVIATLASDLGATVVGEGVEAHADLEAARHLGIAAVQGYLVARPSTNHAELHQWRHEPPWLAGQLLP
jgi:EAL domain-containing protein (putative c-di-GMP-specific phosphodiesterase class I)